MKQFNRVWTIALLLLLLFSPVIAQDDVTPEVTPTIEVAATAEPSPLAPLQSVGEGNNDGDVHNAVDDIVDGIASSLPIIFMGIALLMSVRQIGKPQTKEEYDKNRQEIVRDREQVKKTDSPIDDAMVEFRHLVNEFRGISDSLPIPNPGVPPTFPPVAPPAYPPAAPTPLPPPVITPIKIDVKPSLALWIPINPNPYLKDIGANGLAYTEEDHDGRKVAVPTGYKYRGSTFANSPHPDTFYKHGAGFEMALAKKAGQFGYETSVKNFVLAGRQRFAVVVKYLANFTPVIGTDGSPTVYLGGILRSNGKAIAQLEQHAVVDGEGEAQWVFQTATEHAAIDIEVGVIMPWAVVNDQSTLLWREYRVIPVPDDYGDDVVIHI